MKERSYMNTTTSLRKWSSKQVRLKRKSRAQIKVAFSLAAVLGGWLAGAEAQTNARVVMWGGRTDVPVGLSNVIASAAGSSHGLALKSDHTVVAGGAGEPGQHNTPDDQGQSAVPGDLNEVIAVVGGSYHTLALKSNGTVVAWGAGRPGQTLPPNYGQSTVPANLSAVRAIAAGGVFSLALKSDGTIVAWGGGYDSTNVPADLSSVTEISAGGDH